LFNALTIRFIYALLFLLASRPWRLARTVLGRTPAANASPTRQPVGRSFVLSME